MSNPELDTTDIELLRQRALKYRQLAQVLEGCFDLLNDETTGPEWLEKVAAMASCETAACLWWREDAPDVCFADVHGELQFLVDDWLDLMEPAFARNPSDRPVMLDEIIRDTPMLGPQRMVYCLETTPTRYVFIFEKPVGRPAFTERDRENAMRVMQILAKPVKVRRQLSWLRDVVDLTNKTFDEIPSGFIVFSPSGKFVAANRVARKLIAANDLMRTRNGNFELTDQSKQQELRAEMRRVLELPRSALREYVWHRNLNGSTGPDACMAALLVFPFDSWKLESTDKDRVFVMVLQIEQAYALPEVSQLQEFYQLTKAQARLVRTMMDGNGVEDAAAALNVSVNTVRSHLRAVYGKLGVENKAQMLKRVGQTIRGLRDDQP